MDGTKGAASASSKRRYDAGGLAKLLDRAIAELEDQNEGEADGALVRLPEELADKRTLRHRVRQAMDELKVRKAST